MLQALRSLFLQHTQLSLSGHVEDESNVPSVFNRGTEPCCTQNIDRHVYCLRYCHICRSIMATLREFFGQVVQLEVRSCLLHLMNAYPLMKECLPANRSSQVESSGSRSMSPHLDRSMLKTAALTFSIIGLVVSPLPDSSLLPAKISVVKQTRQKHMIPDK